MLDRMNSVTVQYRQRSFEIVEPFDLPFGSAAERAVEDATDRILDDVDAQVALKCGAWPAPFSATRAFKRRMDRARSDLERSELSTLKMLLETYPLMMNSAFH